MRKPSQVIAALAVATAVVAALPTAASAHTSRWCGHSEVVSGDWYLYYGSYFNQPVLGGYYHYHRVGHHTYPGMRFLHSRNHECGFHGKPGLVAAAADASFTEVMPTASVAVVPAFTTGLTSRPVAGPRRGMCATATWQDENGAQVAEVASKEVAARLGHAC
jgi:hypothetical protein